MGKGIAGNIENHFTRSGINVRRSTSKQSCINILKGLKMEVKRDFENPNVIRMFKTADEEVLAVLAMVADMIEKKTGVESVPASSDDTKPSKWALLSKRIKGNPISLGVYTEEDEKIRREFRENFTFHNDE